MAAENAGNWPPRRDRTATLGIFAVDGPLLPVTSRHIRDILISGLISGNRFFRKIFRLQGKRRFGPKGLIKMIAALKLRKA
jgi:hypothetical protein